MYQDILTTTEIHMAVIVLNTELDQIAERLRENYALAEATTAKMVEAMIEVGRDLIQARELVPHGQLDAWAKNEVGMHPKTVRTYVRFAIHAELLRQHQPKGTLEARRLLAHAGVPQLNSADAIRAEATEMRKDGLTQAEIAEKLQISRPRVSQLLNADKHKARDRAKKREKAEADRALARQRQAASVRKSGNKNASEAYSLTRKALQELDRAKAGMPVAKHKFLQRAMEALYEAEDNIARAVNTD